MNDDFSLRDIEKVDRALYEVIDAIIYVSVETLWGTREGDVTTSKFTVQQIGEIASFLEGQLNNNERFRLQYWDIAKYLFIERSGYVYIVMNFIKTATFRHLKFMPRISDKHLFLTFLNRFDEETNGLRNIDKKLKEEVDKINKKTKQGTVLDLCIKYYDIYKEFLSSLQ